MTAWIIRVLSALLAAAMLPASPAPSAPKAEEQPVGSQQVQQAAAMTETQAPPAIRQTEPEAEKEDAASNAAAPLPEPAQPQDEETGSETPADKPSLSDLSPQFWEIVGLTLNGKLMSSQNPTLIAFAQPFCQWLSDNDYLISTSFMMRIATFSVMTGSAASSPSASITMRHRASISPHTSLGCASPVTANDTIRSRPILAIISIPSGSNLITTAMSGCFRCGRANTSGVPPAPRWGCITASLAQPSWTTSTTPSREKMIPMEMTLYHNGKYKFKREMEKTWWQTGFILCYMCEPEEVTVEARVEFPNEEMRNAFLGTLEEPGYVLDETYTLDGNMVSFAY